MVPVDRQALVEGSRQLLRPLASLLLKCGLTWREFAEIGKAVFVEVASREYGIRGRATNVSRVAILTGIGRREVGKLRQQAAPPPLANQTTDATRLLSGWHQDPEFATADGRPRELAPGGTAGFEQLARRYAPDVPPSAMLKELKRVAAVAEDEAGRLRALRRYYQPIPLDPQWLLNAGSVMADLGANINHNMGAGPGQPSWFLGRATDDAVDARAAAEFRAFLEEEGQRFLEKVDAWLASHRATGGDGSHATRMGVGLFMIRNDSGEGVGP